MPNPPWQGDMNILFEREPGGTYAYKKILKWYAWVYFCEVMGGARCQHWGT